MSVLTYLFINFVIPTYLKKNQLATVRMTANYIYYEIHLQFDDKTVLILI